MMGMVLFLICKYWAFLQVSPVCNLCIRFYTESKSTSKSWSFGEPAVSIRSLRNKCVLYVIVVQWVEFKFSFFYKILIFLSFLRVFSFFFLIWFVKFLRVFQIIGHRKKMITDDYCHCRSEALSRGTSSGTSSGSQSQPLGTKLSETSK